MRIALHPRGRTARPLFTAALLLASAACATTAPSVTPVPTPGQQPAGADPRVGLRAGWLDAGVAARNMELVATRPRPEGFFNARQLGNILLANSDMAFKGDLLFMGSFTGFQIWDISQPSSPRLRTSVLCPGGQGDLSVHGNLLFMSVEMPNGRVDCSDGGFTPGASSTRFLGVRIFDISNLDRPRQVAAVQTCRGSHTHTLIPDPRDAGHVYVYVQGTSGVRPAGELAGCSGLPPEQDPNTALFRIEVIRVPLAAPQNAAVVNSPRIFADAQGNIAGLWRGGAGRAGAAETATTDQCHDITAFPEIGLAAGACSGNGILLDITDPANPRRVHEVFDYNFAYWHSATWNNDGTKVIFTDEWGGGMQARCRAEDPKLWGANALFDVSGRRLAHRGYYKLPVAQSAQENCVAHNGSMVPVPGRDIMVQAWYQGGVSVFDFTDAANPVEIAFFDRGPLGRELLLGGAWSSYWYNGNIYTSEIDRGLDVLRLLPSQHLTQNEIDAANLARYETFNPQTQTRATWPASFVVARAYLDQLRRASNVSASSLNNITTELQRIEAQQPAARAAALTTLAGTVATLQSEASGQEARRLGLLAQTLRDIANAR